MEKEFLAELHYEKLKSRFRLKIEPRQYYLSYSGGRDSHLLYWFIKREKIPVKIISVNTYREHSEIRKRMYDHADKVVYPTMLFEEIKEKYGIPCFTKAQDEIIRRYQSGNRSANTLGRVYGTGTTIFGLNNKARELLISGMLHSVSSHCCKYTKKKPLALYEKENGLKPILAIRGAEGRMRKSAYQTCLSKTGKFTPLYDFTNEAVEAMYAVYRIEDLPIYKILNRTGCIGCPYGYHGKKLTAIELKLATDGQRRYAIESFWQSYDVLGVDY